MQRKYCIENFFCGRSLDAQRAIVLRYVLTTEQPAVISRNTHLLLSPFERTIRQIGAFISLVSLLLFVGCTGPNAASPELSGHLSIVGSTALQPLVTAAATLFQAQHPQVHITVRGGGSLTGLDAVTLQKADIGISDIYADRAVYPDPNLTDHIVCVVAFTMIVGPGVTISSLTHQQLIAIFSTGAIRNWQEVGGPDLPIVPVVRSLSSGTHANFRKFVLGGQDESGNSTGTQVLQDSSDAVREKVSHTPGAIGYIALSAVRPGVHTIGIDGVTSTLANIERGAYTFWSYEHMYTLSEDNLLLSAFLDFMLTQQVQDRAQKLNYIPLAQMKLPTGNISPAAEQTYTLSVSPSHESEGTSRESL